MSTAPTRLSRPSPQLGPQTKRVVTIVAVVAGILFIALFVGGFIMSRNRVAETRQREKQGEIKSVADVEKSRISENSRRILPSPRPGVRAPENNGAVPAVDVSLQDNPIAQQRARNAEQERSATALYSKMVEDARRGDQTARAAAPPPFARDPFTRSTEPIKPKMSAEELARLEDEKARTSPIIAGSMLSSGTGLEAQRPQQISGIRRPAEAPAASQRVSAASDGRGGPITASDLKQTILSNGKGGNTYLPNTRTAPLSKYELKAGWIIPAVLEQNVRSDLPGEMRARVTENVYDTATGRYLLIPQGARLFGTYNSNIAYGQTRIQVTWNRIIYPDGSSVSLEGMTGMDGDGAAGMRGKVDRHLWRTFGMAALVSAFTAAYDVSQQKTYQNNNGYPTAQQLAGASVSREMTQLGQQMARKNLNVQPTITAAAGQRFVVSVSQDILFPGAYEPIPVMEKPGTWRAAR